MTTNLFGHPATYTWHKCRSVHVWRWHTVAFQDFPPRFQYLTVTVCLYPKNKTRIKLALKIRHFNCTKLLKCNITINKLIFITSLSGTLLWKKMTVSG